MMNNSLWPPPRLKPLFKFLNGHFIIRNLVPVLPCLCRPLLKNLTRNFSRTNTGKPRLIVLVVKQNCRTGGNLLFPLSKRADIAAGLTCVPKKPVAKLRVSVSNSGEVFSAAFANLKVDFPLNNFPQDKVQYIAYILRIIDFCHCLTVHTLKANRQRFKVK